MRHDAQARAGRRDQTAQAGARTGDPPRPALRLQRLQGAGPGDPRGREDDQRHRTVRLETQPGRPDPGERRLPDQLAPAVPGGALRQDQIQASRLQLRVQRAGELDGQFQIDLGMIAPERLKNLRQAGDHEVLGGAEPQPARQPGPGEEGRRPFMGLEDRPRETEHRLTVLGEIDAVRVTAEQLATRSLLQPPHMLAHRRLAQPQTARRPREAQRLGDGEKGPQLRRVVHTAMLLRIAIAVRVVYGIPDRSPTAQDGRGGVRPLPGASAAPAP